MATKQAIAEVVAALCEVYNRSPTALTYRAYGDALSDLTDEAVRAAGRSALRSTEFKFMPTPGDLRALAATGGRSMESIAQLAWYALCEGIKRAGPSRSVNFRDGLINATVRLLGGWQYVCEIPKAEYERFTHRSFVELYSRLYVDGCPVELTEYLVGSNERANLEWVGRKIGRSQKPFTLPAPEVIGSNYEPAVVSPAAKLPASRPANVPRLELKRVSDDAKR